MWRYAFEAVRSDLPSRHLSGQARSVAHQALRCRYIELYKLHLAVAPRGGAEEEDEEGEEEEEGEVGKEGTAAGAGADADEGDNVEVEGLAEGEEEAVFDVQLVWVPPTLIPSQLAADLQMTGSQVSIALLAPMSDEDSAPPGASCAAKWAKGLTENRPVLRGAGRPAPAAAAPVVVLSPGATGDVPDDPEGHVKLAALRAFVEGLGPLCLGLCLMEWAVSEVVVSRLSGHMGKLKVLAWMSPEKVEAEAVGALMAAVADAPSMRCLALPGRCLGQGLGAALAKMLAAPACPLRYLLLGPLFESRAAEVEGSLGPLGDEAGAALVGALTGNTTLAVLDLTGCGIGDATAAALGQLLRSNTALTDVILVDNAIGARSATFTPAQLAHACIVHLHDG